MAGALLRCLNVKRRLWLITGAYVALTFPVAFWLLPTGREAPPAFSSARAEPEWKPDAARAGELRTLALRHARVWNPTDVATFDCAANPPDPSGQLSTPLVKCRYVAESAHGTTPKFACLLPDGEVVKVKYGALTAEIHAELAATRLLRGLGFGADHMFLVPRLRCYGCMRTPFYTVLALDFVHMRNAVLRTVPPDSYTDFEWVAVERRFNGTPIEANGRSGWAWFELDDIDSSRGASRDERDALRLAALLIAHWDNKAENQRLTCLTPGSTGSAPCDQPFALINDVGATFGPNKIDLDGWSNAPIWADRSHCIVSMKSFPYDGGTFRDTTISEAGRQLIARQLLALTDRQMTALFTAARFSEFHQHHGRGGEPDAWAEMLRRKIRDIADGDPCPQ